MIRYVLKRILWMIPVILGVAILIFTIMYFVPGDPASIMLGGSGTQAQVEVLREKLGLNEPYFVRLGSYLYNVFIRFDFGTSYVYKTPVISDLLQRLPRTLTIALACIIITTVLGVPLGVFAAVRRGTLSDTGTLLVTMLCVAVPNFWLGMMLVLLFSLGLGWLPSSGVGGPQYFVLPIIANSFGGMGFTARQSRSSMLEIINSDFVVTARAKGVSERDVLFKHALPNALMPIITGMGTGLANMLGGTLVIETVFAIPGIGTYIMNAINSRDYNAVQGSVIFLAITFSIIMLLTDLVYAYLDPRIKAQYARGKEGK